MKISVVVALVLLAAGLAAGSSNQSFAAENPLLTLVHNNLAPPRYRVNYTCSIYKDKMVQLYRGGVTSTIPVTKKVSWTSEVRGPEALVSLIKKASLGKVVVGSTPIGSGLTQYDAYLPVGGRQEAITLKSEGGIQGQRNTSRAAAQLIGFIDYNCGQQ